MNIPKTNGETIVKTATNYLNDANEVVPRMVAEDAIKQHGKENSLYIDVRDSNDIASSGTIAGALRIPRGLIEFAADDTMPTHNKALTKDKNIYLVCGAGRMAALTGKTLIEMGYSSVTNIGGFNDWKEAGGACEA